MKPIFSILLALLLLSCHSSLVINDSPTDETFTIAFGSCNNQLTPNLLWEPIISRHPDLWIWGGDIVYSDTDDMVKLKADYMKVYNHHSYTTLREATPVLGTWDDHDYGLNDGGEEFSAKDESQIQFLDFLGLAQNDPRRDRKGVYHSESFDVKDKKVKVIILDTRYFRTALTPSSDPNRRYEPNQEGEGTILGESQWKWLENELVTSDAQFNIIVSSVQFLSGQHGFESWGNFPHEITKMVDLIQSAQPKGVIFLSGDRHISEFSKLDAEGIEDPIIDFTSSGLTHSYSSFSGEPNKYRIGDVVAEKSFGILELDVKESKAQMSIIGEGNIVLSTISQVYN